jgi:murein DD-endopeptidase MepM/ murein hydrolase activator NlpD
MKPAFILFLCLVLVGSCRTTSRPGLFSKKTPHELYSKRITDAGLQSTALGKSWFNAAALAVAQPLTVTKPYKETGFFSAAKPGATGLKFSATRGEKLQISVSIKPAGVFKLYLDLWRQDTSRTSPPELVASSDTTGIAIEYEVEKAGNYVLRLQPELLQDCEYTIGIAATASLAFPIRAPGVNPIKSYWGASRDAGTRKHEGVDIFAPRLTPVVAAADGRVTRVNENNLGGKVVWMRPEKKNYTLYYAHLDSQLVLEGQRVVSGDTLGLMGNTGNAKRTAPHLHFGIYSMNGAIDPLPFINPDYPLPAEIKADIAELGKLLRVADNKSSLRTLPYPRAEAIMQVPKNTILSIEAATGDFYRVVLPDGQKGFSHKGSTGRLTPLQKVVVKSGESIFITPDSLAAAKIRIEKDIVVTQLAQFGNFNFVETDEKLQGWIIK